MQFNQAAFRKAIRREFTQEELAAKLGKTQQNVSAMVRRGSEMKISQFIQIINALGIEAQSVPQFFTEEN